MTVNFHRLAFNEYMAAVRWYSRRSVRSAERLREEVERALQRIRDDPLRWPVFDDRVRWVRTRRFLYVLYYEIVDDATVRILAVAHARRRPGYWRRRLRSN